MHTWALCRVLAITDMSPLPQDGDYSYRSVPGRGVYRSCPLPSMAVVSLCQVWRLSVFAKYGGCQVKRVGVLEGYDACHCFGAIYSFTAFMHIIYLLSVRRHGRASSISRLACMQTIYCIS